MVMIMKIQKDTKFLLPLIVIGLLAGCVVHPHQDPYYDQSFIGGARPAHGYSGGYYEDPYRRPRRRVRGAARGAAGGAIIGAISGNAGRGAAIGAAAGALFGGRRRY